MRPPRHATIRDSRPGKGDVSLIYLNAFVLALVEGITEFLPISSTGHMILVEQYFPLTANPEDSFRHAFIELIQLPAILAVVVYFWKRIFPFYGDVPDGSPLCRGVSHALIWPPQTCRQAATGTPPHISRLPTGC